MGKCGRAARGVLICGRNDSDSLKGKMEWILFFNLSPSNMYTGLKKSETGILKYCWLLDSFSNHFLNIYGILGCKLHVHTYTYIHVCTSFFEYSVTGGKHGTSNKVSLGEDNWVVGARSERKLH